MHEKQTDRDTKWNGLD